MTERMPDFDGKTYEHDRDHARLGGEMLRVRDVMTDGSWRTLGAIAELTGDPEASISARLRDLRKPKFGGWVVDRRYAGGGLWEYRVSRAAPMAARETAIAPGGPGEPPARPAAVAPPRNVPCPKPGTTFVEGTNKERPDASKRCGRPVFLIAQMPIDPTFWEASCPVHGKITVRVA